jgi:transposase-like protein
MSSDRPDNTADTTDTFYIDEVFVKINGKHHYLYFLALYVLVYAPARSLEG